MNAQQKLIVILGPTASGKSALAVEIAKKIGGEIISADSRQVYKGLTIGTGKITRAEMKGIKHHLLDVASPFATKAFTVADFKRRAEKCIAEITARGHTPILCGGTGFYIQAIVDNIELPNVQPNTSLRKKLEQQKTEKLFETLKKLDPRRAKTIDQFNRPRLIRAIEIATALGHVPKLKKRLPRRGAQKFDLLQIGIAVPQEILREKIRARLTARMKKGMVNEARKLHAAGLSFKRMQALGLEYRHLAHFLQKKTSRTDMLRELENDIIHYSKRQMTWFKRDTRIIWFAPTQSEKKKILHLVQKFLR